MVKNVNFRQEIIAYVLLVVGSILFAVGDVMFVNPYLMAPGGTYGLSNGRFLFMPYVWIFHYLLSERGFSVRSLV